ncbi:MAG TPA: hypothetical protein PKB02_03295 [Anaerohalosphaeraceae bacterium]|nr:hypothetical protein [Anaerohalosphaeraceae bacterium]
MQNKRQHQQQGESGNDKPQPFALVLNNTDDAEYQCQRHTHHAEYRSKRYKGVASPRPHNHQQSYRNPCRRQ